MTRPLHVSRLYCPGTSNVAGERECQRILRPDTSPHEVINCCYHIDTPTKSQKTKDSCTLVTTVNLLIQACVALPARREKLPESGHEHPSAHRRSFFHCILLDCCDVIAVVVKHRTRVDKPLQ